MLRKWIENLLKREKRVKRRSGEIKQVIVVRQDLRMGKGKAASQVAHASVLGYVEVNKRSPYVAAVWLNRGMKKVVLKVKTKREFKELYKRAKKRGLPVYLIRDAGRTQVSEGEETVLSIGPWYEEEIDEITGQLKLL